MKKSKTTINLNTIFLVLILILILFIYYTNTHYSIKKNNLEYVTNDKYDQKTNEIFSCIFNNLLKEYTLQKKLYENNNKSSDINNQIELIKRKINLNDYLNISNDLNKLASMLDVIFCENDENSLFYSSGVLLMNKIYGASKEFNPGFRTIAENSFNNMRNDAEKENICLINFSDYRSYSDQEKVYNKYVQQDGENITNTYSAKPGFSEHQSGYALDIGGKNKSLWAEEVFENTQEYQWLEKNAYKYGFIMRYPKGKEKITGYIYEPWHYRYVGEISNHIYKSNLTLEEFLEDILKNV